MMRTQLMILAGTILAGLMFGLVFSGGVLGGDNGRADHWTTPTLPNDDDSQKDFFAAMMATGHFGTISDDQPSATSDGPQDTPAPPAIVAVTEIDGVVRVSFFGGTGAVASASVGDVTTGGWTITDATLKWVTMTREGETVSVQVFQKEDPES